MPDSRLDLTRVTLSVAFIVGLTFASGWIFSPFLGATVWATMLAVATWPLMVRAQSWLGGRRWAAVLFMTLAMALIFVVPATISLVSIASNAGDMTAWVTRIATNGLPAAPDWVARIPAVGRTLANGWNGIAKSGAGGLATYLRPYMSTAALWLLARLSDVGGTFVQFLLTLGITAVMYVNGEAAVAGVRAFAGRLLGERGHATVDLAGKAVRSVALGVVVTALVQAALGGAGILVAGVPYAMVLTVVMFLLCIAQVGPWLVMIACTVWVFGEAGAGWGTFMAIWTLIVGLLDNFLRPWLIKRGANISLLLILPGVIGGLLTLGLLGIFIGPVLLVVTYTLLEAWVTRDVPHATTG
jgi:predicted PurR-regulated permease PerM